MSSKVRFLRTMLSTGKKQQLSILELGTRTDNPRKSLYQVTGDESQDRFKSASQKLNNDNNFFSAITNEGPNGERLRETVMLVESKLDSDDTEKAITTAFR